ncbi:3'-5' exonuclease [Nocardia goodfellowii]
MGQRLIESMATTTFAVIDFEYTTPTGAPREPFEVAVQILRVNGDNFDRTGEFQALMKPPSHAALTDFDSGQTGITAAMLTDAPPAAEVLARLDRRFTAGPYLLVAHNAPAEAGILAAYRAHCPILACLAILDTVRMARKLYPDLPKHNLDILTRHLGITQPPDRHRAMADVAITAEAFVRMIADGPWMNLDHLRADTAYIPVAPEPEQITLSW